MDSCCCSAPFSIYAVQDPNWGGWVVPSIVGGSSPLNTVKIVPHEHAQKPIFQGIPDSACHLRNHLPRWSQ